MGVSAIEAGGEGVSLAAPLAPNINHRSTVFGGSAAAVATLAAWSLLYLRLEAAALPARIVIQENTMQYRKPIAGTFTASTEAILPNVWQTFVATLQRRGRARIEIRARLDYAGAVAGNFSGAFVAQRGAAMI